MSTQIKRRRGSSAEIALFTPALGEWVHNTDDNTIHTGSGVKVGGYKAYNEEALINDLSQDYEFATVALMVGSSIQFPAGKSIRVKENTGTYIVLAGTGTGNGLNIKASTSVSQSFSLKRNDDGNINLIDAGIIYDGPAGTDQKAAIETIASSMSGDMVAPVQTSQIKLSAAPNIGAKSIILGKFDQVDPLILKDMQAMVSEKGYRGGTAQATQFKKWGLDVITGALRKEALGGDKWFFISNAQGQANHETIGFDNTIKYTAAANSLTLPMNLITHPTSEVLTVVCAPDESLAGSGLTVGASVAPDELILKMSFNNNFIREFIYDGSSNFTMNTISGELSDVSFSLISPNLVRVVFSRMAAPNIDIAPIGAAIPHLPSIKTFNNSYTMDIKFLDIVNGTLNPSFSASHNFRLSMMERTGMILNGSTGGAPSDVGDKILTTGTSNIFIHGIQKAIG